MKLKLHCFFLIFSFFFIQQISFAQDTDGDSIMDNMDDDADNDGILDSVEKGNSTVTTNECGNEEDFDFSNLPTEILGDGNINTLLDGETFRFANVGPGIDGLLTINSRVNATCDLLDDNSSQTEYLKPGTRSTTLSQGQEGYIEYTLQFVTAGSTTPVVIPEFFMNLNDIDGDTQKAERVKISIPYSYIIDNPTDVTVTQENDFLIATSGTTNYQGTSNAFSTVNLKARYFNRSSITFQMGILARVNNVSNIVRYFSLEFSCVNNFTDPQISFSDADNDGIPNYKDIDSDNDGIPDNVEAQTTLGYIQPSNTFSGTGVDANYSTGLTPIDTDGDGIPDYLDPDSDNDGVLDVNENGISTPISNNDTDGDGLDDSFETSGINDTTHDVNEDIDDPSDLSILPDSDGDLLTNGDLDFRDLFDVNPPISASLAFDGDDDYLSRPGFLDNSNQVTLMAWVKVDPANASQAISTIAGEGDACRLVLQNGNVLGFRIHTAQGTETRFISSTIAYNEWHHVTGSFSNITGQLNIFVDGELIESSVLNNHINEPLTITSLSNGNFEVGRKSTSDSEKEYFQGEIDELRVFNLALTKNQVQRLTFQEIENNSGLVRGKIIPKNITDQLTNNDISWSNLLAYYPMTNIKKNTTDDYSQYNLPLKINNITLANTQTAPMPFETSTDGDWSDTNTWLHGDVWDIENATTNIEGSIVNIKNNISTSNSHLQLGLLIDNNKTFVVNGDHKVENTWYLQLNGTLDLKNDSQLIQTEYSDLVTNLNGKILRRQEGNSSVYWYNYWASPVGALSATALTDNNGSSNNVGNSSFQLNMLKKGDDTNVQFTTAHNEVGKVSTRWTYVYQNGVLYTDYASIDENTNLNPGVGYTQKGTGSSGSEQQYIFEGKPNNGTILVNGIDVGGSGSTPSVSKTDYLLGNPYPSAIDLHAFILDNSAVIDGNIQLWQQWSGNSHFLNEYNGGYATVNLTGSVRASQFVGFDGADSGGLEGTKLPTRYLPVGQGFNTEIVSTGNVIFKNSQRVFVKEADADGTSDNGSVFLRSSQNAQDGSISEENILKKIRLEFNSVDGPNAKRELLLAFGNHTTDDFDYGYEAEMLEPSNNDMSLILDDKLMSIQAYCPVTDSKIVPLSIKISNAFNYNIKITNLENFEDDQVIYLKDNFTGNMFDLRSNEAYEFSSEIGTFNNRFEIVFQAEQALSTNDDAYQYHLIYFNTDNSKLYVKGLENKVKQVQIINMLGQTVQEFTDVDSQDLNNGLQLSALKTGTYIAYFNTETGIITKKILAK